MGIVGTIPETTLNAFGALREVNFTSDPSQPFANVITLPPGDECASVEVCKTIMCDFGADAPSCYKPAPPPSSGSGLSSGAIFGIVIGAFAGVALLSGVGYVAYTRSAASKKKDKRRQKKKKKLAKKRSAKSMGGRRPSMAAALKRRMSLGKKKQSFRKVYRPKNEEPDAPGTWIQTFDPVSGAQYWMNNVTGEFSWTPPQLNNPPPNPYGMQRMASGYGNNFGGPMVPATSPAGPMMPYSPGPPMMGGAGMPQQGDGYAFRGAPGGFGSVGAPMRGGGFQALARGQQQAAAPPGGGGILRNAGNSGPIMAPPIPQSRPDRWEEVYDSATDRSYWVSASTGQISYNPPPGMI